MSKIACQAEYAGSSKLVQGETFEELQAAVMKKFKLNAGEFKMSIETDNGAGKFDIDDAEEFEETRDYIKAEKVIKLIITPTAGAPVVNDEASDKAVNTPGKLDRNVGLAMANGKMSVLLEQGTEFPCSATKTFTNSEDDQDFIITAIYKGNDEYIQGNIKIQDYPVVFDPCPRGSAIITITVQYDAEGQFNVTSDVKTPDKGVVMEQNKGTTTTVVTGTGYQAPVKGLGVRQDPKGCRSTKDIGIAMANGDLSVVIPKNTLLPCTVEKNYTNSHANMTVFSIDVYEGVSNQIANCRYLRKHDATMVPSPAGSALITLTFKYNAYGELDIKHKIDGPGQDALDDSKNFQYNEVKEEFKMPQVLAPTSGPTVVKAVGVAMPDDSIDVIVPKGTPLPCRKETQYSNNMDGQKEFEIEIY